MSRIGKTPVYLPDSVSVDVNESSVIVKGPKGDLSLQLHPNVSVEKKEEEGKEFLKITVQDEKMDAAIWGTFRSHLNNMVRGVSEGWVKSLELNGVGYRMSISGQKLKISVGFSHDIDYELPQGVIGTVEENVLTITGVDKETVGHVAAEIRAFKKPEPYKGKGFRYTDEVIRRKVGKAAKVE